VARPYDCHFGPCGPENREVKAWRLDLRNALEESRQHSGERLSNEVYNGNLAQMSGPGGSAPPQGAGVCAHRAQGRTTSTRSESGVVKSATRLAIRKVKATGRKLMKVRESPAWTRWTKEVPATGTFDECRILESQPGGTDPAETGQG